jgi:hypothetical protein
MRREQRNLWMLGFFSQLLEVHFGQKEVLIRLEWK